MNFAPPILSKRLAKLNFPQYTYGIVFAIPCVVPVFSLVLANYLMHKFSGNAILIIGTLHMSAGFIVVASDNSYIFLLGIAILGFSAPFAILPLFPMMSNTIDKNESNGEVIKNTLSGLYNA